MFPVEVKTGPPGTKLVQDSRIDYPVMSAGEAPLVLGALESTEESRSIQIRRIRAVAW